MTYADDKIQDSWTASAVGTSAGVTATKAGVAGVIYLVTNVACSGDAAALVTIEAPTGTVLWRKRFAAAFTHSESFMPGVIKGAPADAASVKVSASTSNSEANISGYSI